MPPIQIEISSRQPVARRHVEIVERKGKGHPDTICDSIADSVSVALCRAYLEAAGRVLHHNVDKMLLVAGTSRPTLGGGAIDAPIQMILGDRATMEWNRQPIPVWEIAEEAARRWISQNLRYVDPNKHVVFQNELHPGSTELAGIFGRAKLVANDTSAAVGSAPETETERLVLATEHYLNSAEIYQRFPFVGEDVKVLGVRQNRNLRLTIAVAFVDRCIRHVSDYFAHKQELCDDLLVHLLPQLHELDHLNVEINTLDDPALGENGLYLTVLGTSADGADGGEVGRGNRVNGLISLSRPMSMEAAAGKNPVSHVGKIYNVFAHELAQMIVTRFSEVHETNVWLCSQIGQPLNEPWVTSIELVLADGADSQKIAQATRQLVEHELSQLDSLTDRLIRGAVPMC